MGFKEKRKAKRVDARLAITLSGGKEEAKGETLNVSTNGVYFQSPFFVEPLTKLRLELMIPQPDGRESSAKCDGIVVRVEPEREDPSVDKYNVAVFFTSIDKGSQKVLTKYIMSKIS